MLGERLREARERLGLTQAQLGALLHVSGPTITRYETGVNKPNPETLRELAKVLRVSVDYLLGLTDLPTHSISVAKEAAALYRATEGLPPEDLERLYDYIKYLKYERQQKEALHKKEKP
jgi:transcriptional regulator with XRE-family HTH domain